MRGHLTGGLVDSGMAGWTTLLRLYQTTAFHCAQSPMFDKALMLSILQRRLPKQLGRLVSVEKNEKIILIINLKNFVLW